MPVAPPSDLGSVVHGPCAVYFGCGNTGPLYFLGICQDGGKQSIHQLALEIPDDIAGPLSPADFQDMGSTANLSAALSQVSLENLEVMMAARYAGSPSGAGYLRGQPIAANGLHLRIIFSSDLETKRFRTCILKPSEDHNQGTRFSIYQFHWFAWQAPFVGSSGSFGLNPLFDNVEG